MCPVENRYIESLVSSLKILLIVSAIFSTVGELYAQGRTKKGKIVTNAKAGYSWHNYGLAIDICILFDTNNDGTFETASFKVDKYWMIVTNYLKSKGWNWGGDWKTFKDYPHFEITHGFSLSEARRRYMQRKFIPNTQYITI